MVSLEHLTSPISIALYLLTSQSFVNSSADQSSQLVLSHDTTFPQICPAIPPLSCHFSSGGQKVDSCCTNVPGGQLLLTQFWDSHPATGPSDSWTIHGLWPDNCDGTYEAFCDSERSYHNITQILEQGGGHEVVDFMRKYWKDQHGNDETFWQHEWAKHGTCISTLEPRCMGSSYQPQSEVVTFFNKTVELFKSLSTYEWLKDAGIVPSPACTYTLDQLQEVAKKHTGKEAVWNCRGHLLNEVWWHFNTVGTVADGKFVNAHPVGPRSTCPYKGIQYLPKGRSGGDGGGEDGHRPKHPHDPPHNSPSREHFVYVLNSEGKRDGCLISNGNWYIHGTCASFSLSVGKDDSIISIRTRKGPCAFEDSGFKCAKGLKSEQFSLKENRLLHDGQDVFYSDELPNGRSQVRVIKSKAKNAISLEIAAAH